MATTLAQTTNAVDVDAKRRDIVAQAEASGLRLVRFLYCDNDGIIRGKSAGVRDLHDRLETGIGLTLAMQAFTMLDHLASVEGMGPVGEIRLVPDPNTFAIAPYAPHTATVLVDMQTLDGQPYAADGRFFLKRMIARAADGHDLSLIAAFEPEWSLAIKTGDQFTPIDDSGCFTSTGMNMAAPVIDDIVAALESQGMTVEQYYAELGWGQQELSIRHAPALQAADHHIMYRETVRGIALQHGRYASFAPKPWGVPPALLGVDEGPARQPFLRRRRRVQPVDAGAPVHGRDPRPPAGTRCPHLCLGQLLPPAPAPDVGFGLSRLGSGQPGGRAAGRLSLQGPRSRVDQRRAEVVRLERQPVHLARRGHGRRARWD
ncbi:MAG: hypothetical protein E6I25_04985, partial [Chloroflexi bacterium]